MDTTGLFATAAFQISCGTTSHFLECGASALSRENPRLVKERIEEEPHQAIEENQTPRQPPTQPTLQEFLRENPTEGPRPITIEQYRARNQPKKKRGKHRGGKKHRERRERKLKRIIERGFDVALRNVEKWIDNGLYFFCDQQRKFGKYLPKG
uniref:Uncharacterized protein n=1 Tax=Lutzomyia longipalpis TaxID=7200 RepID=A0A1B0GIK6_LUTLO